jgi:hypothetical protein
LNFSIIFFLTVELFIPGATLAADSDEWAQVQSTATLAGLINYVDWTYAEHTGKTVGGDGGVLLHPPVCEWLNQKRGSRQTLGWLRRHILVTEASFGEPVNGGAWRPNWKTC